MARMRSATALDRTLTDILLRTSAEVALVVRRSIAEEVATLITGPSTGGVRVSSAVLGRPRQRKLILCPVPRCGRRGGGPKWGWCCEIHKDLPAEEKTRARQTTRPRPRASRARAAQAAR